MKNYSKLLTMFMIAMTLLLAVSSCKKDDDDDDDVKPTTLSSEKKVLTFSFNEFTPAIVATINETTKSIAATVPATADLTALVPTITISEKASVSPASDIEQDFTNPVNYTVTAEDNSVQIYTVTVTLDTYQAEILSGSMSSNRTLPDVWDGIDYVVEGPFYIEGNALLTIEAGVKIAFTGIDGEINVGENAGLKFAGTASDPIILTGPVNNQNKGAWSCIVYNSSRSDNIIDYTYFEYGGSENSSYDNSTIYIAPAASAKIRNSKISHGGGYGIAVEGELKEFSGCTIENCNNSPIILHSLCNATSGIINSTNTFIGNTNNYVHVYYSTPPSGAYTLSNAGIPYYFGGGLYIESDFTIENGTGLLFGSAMGFYVADGSKLTAIGTASSKITFNGLSEEPGYWDGINFEEQTRTSTLDYCVIDNAGNTSDWGAGILAVYNLSISNTIIQNSYGYGAIISDNSNITHSNVTFVNCADGNVYNWDTEEITPNFP